MKRVDSIKELVGQIKVTINANRLDSEALESFIAQFKKLGHDGYDEEKFPQLNDMSGLDAHIGESPESLAEALLWKLGKWPAYKAFVNSYSNKKTIVSASGGVVFNAFAKHLQNNCLPIYDQHAIRALWVLSDFSDEEQDKCRRLLFKKDETWKPTGSGDDGSCYRIFTEHIEKLCRPCSLQHGLLDKLLMPLGQAIKKQSKNWQEFESFLV